jgi:predicted MFS family arabinose efflux permease
LETLSSAPAIETELDDAKAAVTEDRPRALQRMALLLATGWLGTNLGIAVADLPLKFLLKDDLHLTPRAIAAFFALGAFTNYIKPVAGLLVDSFPLFGARRRYYLLLSLLGSGLLWLLLAFVPRNYGSLLATYSVLYMTIVFTSTTLGGVMVEAGTRYGAAGRLTAQRIGMFRLASLVGGPIGGVLASSPFALAMAITAGLHLILVPLYYVGLPEARTARPDRRVWKMARAQLGVLAHSKTLLSAAGMICLVAAAPGFGTPLLFHQTDTLHFSKKFIGALVLVSAATGLFGAAFYHMTCRRLNLRGLLTGSILIHALGTLFYLFYHSQVSALWITGLSGITVTLATLPVYDLAARATPRGSEAIGYSLMMSVWNLTNALSDWSGSFLYDRFHLTFLNLVWLNAGTTALALVAVPFLPLALILRRDGSESV